MVAYFRLQNNLCMVLGAAAGLLAAVFGLGGIIGVQVIYIRLFLIALCVLAGVVLGRLLSSVAANVRIRKLNATLYRFGDPEGFLASFEPVARRIPAGTVEHVDAQTKIAYACEALGRTEDGLAAIANLKPRELKLHALQCTALVENQRMRLLLLKEDAEAAAEQLKTMDELQYVAERRAPVLGQQLAECVRLGECWLNILRNEECDLDYIRDQIANSQNRIHKAEMQLLLGLGLKNEGDPDGAKTAFASVLDSAPDLYAATRARAELEN